MPPQEKRIFYAGKNGIACYGAPELPYRLIPPLPIQLAGKIDETGQQKLIVNCKRLVLGKGLCGPEGPACYFTPLAQAGLPPDKQNPAVLLFEIDQLRSQQREDQTRIAGLERKTRGQEITIQQLESALLRPDPPKPVDSQEPTLIKLEESDASVITTMTNYGEATLDTDKHTFTIAEHEIPLIQVREQIMRLLLLNQGKVVSIDAIHEAVKDLRNKGLLFAHHPRDTINGDMRHIRNNLGEAYKDLIERVRVGRAYVGFRIAEPKKQ